MLVTFSLMTTGNQPDMQPVASAQTDAWWRALTENLADSIVVLDQTGVITYDHPTPHRFLGDDTGELLGQSAFALVHPDDLPLAQSLFAEIFQTPDAMRTAALRLRHRDGSWRDVVVTGKNLLTNPAVAGVVLTARDVTANKKAARELQERLDELTRFNRAAIGRELRMIELKQEVNTLCVAAGQPPRYPVDSRPHST